MPDHIISMVDTHITSIHGVVWYWIPMVLCLLGYAIKTIQNYRADLERRIDCIQHPHHRIYYHTDTIGDVALRFMYSVIPVINVSMLFLDVLPSVFAAPLRRLRNWLHQPIVPHIKR